MNTLSIEAKNQLTKVILRSLVLIVLPALYTYIQLFILYDARGPHWVLDIQDLGYNYLLNGLNFVSGEPLGTLIHPAIIPIIFTGVVTFLTYLLVGEGSLVGSVIGNAEFYFTWTANSAIVLSGLALLIVGLASRLALKSTPLAVLLQSFPFLVLPQDAIGNSFGSPEHFVSIFSLFLVSFTLRTKYAGFDDPSSMRSYAIISALVCALAITSKFTAAPLAALPFLLVKTWRLKLLFCGYLTLFITLAFLPIFSNFDNLRQFYGDFRALLFWINYESDTSSGSMLSTILYSLTRFPAHYKLISFVISGLTFLWIVIFIKNFPNNDSSISDNKRLILATLFTLAIAILFISIRAKWKYFAPYIPLVGLTTILYLETGKIWIERRTSMTAWSALNGSFPLLAVIVLMIGSINAGYIQYQDIRATTEESLGIESISRRKVGENGSALITAVQASTPAGAFDHANQTSRFIYRNEIASLFPNQYTYAWDGFSVHTFDRLPLDIYDLLNYYTAVYFQTTRPNYHVDRPGLSAPKIIVKTISSGKAQLLAKIIAVAEKGAGTISSGEPRAWEVAECDFSESGFCFNQVVSVSECLSHLAISAKEIRYVDHYAKNIQVYGSNDKTRWDLLVDGTKPTEVNYHKDPTVPPKSKVIEIPNKSVYGSYRVSVPKKIGHTNNRPEISITTFKSNGCQIPNNKLFHLLKFPKRIILNRPFWEQTGSYPHSISKLTYSDIRPIKYTLITGNHGENGIDSWGRMPSSWDIQGSVDGKIWTTIHSVRNEPKWKPNEIRIYEIPNSQKAYSNFRLKAFDGWNKDIIRIEIIAVFGT